MESACLFDAWLHETGGYTYHGDAPITGLTRFELDKLQLGWVVKQERKEDAMQANAKGRSTHTQQRKSDHERRLERRSRKAQQN